MMKKLMMPVLLGAAVILSGCTADGSLYRSDTFSTQEVNRLQQVKLVEIVELAPARIKVNNRNERRESAEYGALLGAVAGVAIGRKAGHSSTSKVIGGLTGAAVGSMAGKQLSGKDQHIVDGVQITFNYEGKTYSSTQVGLICEYRLGPARLVAATATETRIQPNNPYGCPRQSTPNY